MAKNSKLVAKLFFHPGSVQPAPGALPLPVGGCQDASPSRSGLLSEEERLPLCRAPNPPPQLLSLWG